MSLKPDLASEARRDSSMATSRLEHALLQTVINHTAENKLSRAEIILALINVAGYWQKKVILADIHKRIDESK